MPTPVHFLDEYVMRKAQDESLHTRSQIYRALAAIATSAARRRELTALAVDLEAIEARHDQLVLDFKRRAEG